MKNYIVDVIMPVHNTPVGYLREAIKSCLSQSYKINNLIIIDDCSDSDCGFVKDLHPSIKYIRNEKNLGPAGARNAGIKSKFCTGNLITFLDADDIMEREKVALSVREFEKTPGIGMTCGNYRILVNRSRLLKPFYKSSPTITWETLMRKNFVASGSVTVRKEVIEDVGLFDERFWIAEDADLWIKISEKYNIKYINKVLYYYSVIPNGSSLTQRSDIQAKHMENLKIIKAESRERMKNGSN